MSICCRWCGVSFDSRNAVFRHVRETVECTRAAEAEDSRATVVLQQRGLQKNKSKTHSVALLCRYTCSHERAILCLTQCLLREGAAEEEVEVRCADSHARRPALQSAHENVVFARVACTRAVEEVLGAAASSVRPHSQEQVQMLAWHVIPSPSGDFEVLCKSDFSFLMRGGKLQCPTGGGGGTVVQSSVTVVVTTSPYRSDPELAVLQTTFASLALAGLDKCRKLLVCDHLEVSECSPAEAAQKNGRSLKKGSLSQLHIDRYNERLAALKHASWAKDITVLELKSWHGFARATQRALELVETPVCVHIEHTKHAKRNERI